MDARKDFLLALAFMAFGVILAWMSLDLRAGRLEDPIGPRAFPLVTGLVISFVSGALAIRRVKQARGSEPRVESESAAEDHPDHPASTWRAMSIWLAMTIYFVLLPFVGFDILTPVIIAAMLGLMDVRRPTKLLAIPIVSTVTMHLVFIELLGVRLPLGLLQAALS